MIESFIVNIHLVIENYVNLREALFVILSKLCKIDVHNFGVYCFDALKDFMMSGTEISETVEEIITKEIIVKLED